MSAAYSTGSAASPTALLQALVSWLVSQGWTSDASASEGSGWRSHLHKNSQYVHMRSMMVETNLFLDQATPNTGSAIGLYMGTGYNSGANWNAQAGAPVTGTPNNMGVGMNLPAGAIVAYHFFDDGKDNITVVVEKVAGFFVFMGWGLSMTKLGFSNNYWYFYGSTPSYELITTTAGISGVDGDSLCPMAHSCEIFSSLELVTGFIRVDSSLLATLWAPLFTGGVDTADFRKSAGQAHSAAIMASMPVSYRNEHPTYDGLIRPYSTPNVNRLNSVAYSRSLLLPLHCYIRNVNSRWTPIGYPPSIYLCEAVGSGYSAGAVLAIGGINYKLFPHFAVYKGA